LKTDLVVEFVVTVEGKKRKAETKNAMSKKEGLPRGRPKGKRKLPTRRTGVDAGIKIVERLFAGLARVRFTGITCLKRRSKSWKMRNGS
jgi:hypothetical protein